MSAAAPLPPFPAVSERIAAVIFALCQTLTTRVRGATVTMTQAQLTYIVGRLLGIRKRFNRLVERIRAGKPPREWIRKPRAARPAPDPEFPLGFRPPPKGWRRWAVRPDKPVPPWRALRQHTFGWLFPLAPSVFGCLGSAARHREELLRLLAEPEVLALLSASRRVGDTLRPLCWMLAIESSVLYPVTPATRAAVVPTPDRLARAPAPAAANPVPDENEGQVAPATGLIAPDVPDPPAEPPRGREDAYFFKTA